MALCASWRSTSDWAERLAPRRSPVPSRRMSRTSWSWARRTQPITPRWSSNSLGGIGFVHQLTADGDAPQDARAVAIASRHPFDEARQPITAGPNRQRLLEVRVGDVLVGGAYFPLKKPKVAFWRDEFLPYAESRLDEPAILIGDWNSGQPYRDEAGATLYAVREFSRLSEMGWVDAWRSRNPDGREFTWYSKPYGNGFRLDHAFLSPSLAPRLLDVRYDHSTRESGTSDHSALVVDLKRVTVSAGDSDELVGGKDRAGAPAGTATQRSR